MSAERFLDRVANGIKNTLTAGTVLCLAACENGDEGNTGRCRYMGASWDETGVVVVQVGNDAAKYFSCGENGEVKETNNFNPVAGEVRVTWNDGNREVKVYDTDPFDGIRVEAETD